MIKVTKSEKSNEILDTKKRKKKKKKKIKQQK